MLLTITTTHYPATDLGYLLHKNPENVHSVSCSFGKAYLFYSQATDEVCTANVLLDINPIDLMRRKDSKNLFELEQYVNDRPYVASSFMSVALVKLFGTLLSGRSKYRQELVDLAIPLVIFLPVLPSRGGKELLQKLFEPLGYALDITEHELDPRFPKWGNSPYYSIELSKTCSLKEFLTHLYVLIPVLDDDKHYWTSHDEVEKLLKFGAGWLEMHPEKELISQRYLKKIPGLVSRALTRLVKEQDLVEKETGSKVFLNQERYLWTRDQLKRCGAKRVIDLGCGEGSLLATLFDDAFFDYIVGCDVSIKSLKTAHKRLKVDRLPEFQAKRISLMQGALTYKDDRLVGYDAATLIEVIEHLDESRLNALIQVVFGYAQSRSIIITTPNAEYNTLFNDLKKGCMRHSDHRFEWTRQQFQQWALQAAQRFDYTVTFDGIGEEHELYGFPTQAGVFIKNEQ